LNVSLSLENYILPMDPFIFTSFAPWH